MNAILDIPKTLEYLETKGVPVITWGQEEFPGFWSSTSGLTLQLSTNDLDDVVALIQAQEELDLPSGIVIGVPVPTEYEIPLEEAEEFVAVAVDESAHVQGGDVTPWMLTRIVEITDGRSETANMFELVNNARHAAKVAVALAEKTNA